MEALIPFVQDQFKREGWWCWETVVEEVASHLSITLDADQMVYAGGTLRTERYAFRRNDSSWRALCRDVTESDSEAGRVVDEIRGALKSSARQGVATAWCDQVMKRVDSLPGDCMRCAEQILRWDGMVWDGGRSLDSKLDSIEGIVYGLWRVDSRREPIVPLPLYVGETGGTMSARIEGAKGHRLWWGEGKPMGVTIYQVAPMERKRREEAVIEGLVPFCNVKGSQLRNLWSFPSPAEGSRCTE